MNTQSYIRLSCHKCNREDHLFLDQLKELQKKYSPRPYPCPYCKAEALKELDLDITTKYTGNN